MRDPVQPTNPVLNTTEMTSHITVNEKVPNHRFQRFVEEKMRDWMREHDIVEAEAEYDVAFFDEEALDEISCLVVLHSGTELYRAWESADDPRLALRRSLENLRVEDPLSGDDDLEPTVTEPVTH